MSAWGDSQVDREVGKPPSNQSSRAPRTRLRGMSAWSNVQGERETGKLSSLHAPHELLSITDSGSIVDIKATLFVFLLGEVSENHSVCYLAMSDKKTEVLGRLLHTYFYDKVLSCRSKNPQSFSNVIRFSFILHLHSTNFK